MIKELNVELIGHYGSDMTHAQSAWTSTARDITEEKKTRIPELLKYLAEHEHETPFEKSFFHFLVEVDQATHIHILKHRIGVSVNGESARYKELMDKYYIPEDWGNILVKEKGQLDWLGTLNGDNLNWGDVLSAYTELGNKLYHMSLNQVNDGGLGRKRAKETSRFFRSMNTMITLDVSFNWRSFYHFYQLRSAENAQVEVRIIANKMLELIKEIPTNPFQHTISAFGLNK